MKFRATVFAFLILLILPFASVLASEQIEETLACRVFGIILRPIGACAEAETTIVDDQNLIEEDVVTS